MQIKNKEKSLILVVVQGWRYHIPFHWKDPFKDCFGSKRRVLEPYEFIHCVNVHQGGCLYANKNDCENHSIEAVRKLFCGDARKTLCQDESSLLGTHHQQSILFLIIRYSVLKGEELPLPGIDYYTSLAMRVMKTLLGWTHKGDADLF